jgi:hypothetical protein
MATTAPQMRRTRTRLSRKRLEVMQSALAYWETEVLDNEHDVILFGFRSCGEFERTIQACQMWVNQEIARRTQPRDQH